MRKQTKIAALVSAAALLTIGASMTSFAGKWDIQDGQWVYLDNDGERVEYEWRKSGADWYYLGEGGYMATDQLIDDDDDIYYVGSDGRRVINDWRSVPNDDGEEINDTVVDTLWYYFGSTGKAYRAKDDKELVKKTVPWSGGSNVFFFDTQGHMWSGWITNYLEADGKTQSIYYLGDETEGWARAEGVNGSNGWYYLELPEEYKTLGGPARDYEDEEWFFFQKSGKAYRADPTKDALTTTKYINSIFYTFDKNGVLQDEWFETATDQQASQPSAFTGVDGEKAGWVYTHRKNDEDTYKWYYLMNLSKGKMVAYGSGHGEKDLYVKSINGKTYAFDGNGEMLSGLVEVDSTDSTKYQSQSGWNGQSSIVLADGIYLFSKEAHSSGGNDGRMLTGKQSYTNDDGDTYYYYFSKANGKTGDGHVKGKAITNEVKDGCYYGEDGKRVEATDGNSYEPVVVTVKGGVTVDDYKPGIKQGKTVIVSNIGKIKKSGNVTIDGTVYEVDNYVVTYTYEKGDKTNTRKVYPDVKIEDAE